MTWCNADEPSALKVQAAEVVLSSDREVNVYHVAQALNKNRSHRDLEEVRIALHRARNISTGRVNESDPYLTTFR